MLLLFFIKERESKKERGIVCVRTELRTYSAHAHQQEQQQCRTLAKFQKKSKSTNTLTFPSIIDVVKLSSVTIYNSVISSIVSMETK